MISFKLYMWSNPQSKMVHHQELLSLVQEASKGVVSLRGRGAYKKQVESSLAHVKQ
jgi:hypothetical protein